MILIIFLYFDYYYGNPFLIVWMAYVLIPIVDFLIPVDHCKLIIYNKLLDNLPESKIKAYEKDWRFLIPVYLVFFLDYAVYYGLLYAVSTG